MALHGVLAYRRSGAPYSTAADGSILWKHKSYSQVCIRAKDVDATGLDLGESQAILLKKIEELTLYIIDQQKELEQLKDISKQVAALQKEIELLKSGSN